MINNNLSSDNYDNDGHCNFRLLEQGVLLDDLDKKMKALHDHSKKVRKTKDYFIENFEKNFWVDRSASYDGRFFYIKIFNIDYH